jgi:hypothetical protein
MFHSDFNLAKINTKEFSEHLDATIEFGGALFAVARRGSGKTSITQAAIAKAKCKEIYFNLSLKERPDLAGYPKLFGGSFERYVKFLLPSNYQDLIEGEQPCVLVFDEVDKAESGLLGPLLEIIQERSIDGIKFKNLQAIVMTGNLPAEGGSRPPPTLLDRAEKFLIEIDPRHWLEWAATTGKIHSSIIAFISDNLSDLCGPVELGDDFSNASPRMWHQASKIVSHGEINGWNKSLLMQKVAGCVGKRASIKYEAFFEHYQILLPLVNKIMDGDKINSFENLEATKKLIISIIMCNRFAKMLDDIDLSKDKFISSNTVKIGHNIANFLLNNVDPEVCLVALRQIGADRVMKFDLIEDRVWDKILTQCLSKLS